MRIISAFSTPADHYTSLYLECPTITDAAHLVESANYPSRDIELIVVDNREALLDITLPDLWTWVRVKKDGRIGYALSSDWSTTEFFYAVAVPPLLPPLRNPPGVKEPRLYTIEDLEPILKANDMPFLLLGLHGNWMVHTKSGREYEFSGPLEVVCQGPSGLVPVEAPNPFDLTLFLEARLYWPVLLQPCKTVWDYERIMLATSIHSISSPPRRWPDLGDSLLPLNSSKAIGSG